MRIRTTIFTVTPRVVSVSGAFPDYQTDREKTFMFKSSLSPRKQKLEKMFPSLPNHQTTSFAIHVFAILFIREPRDSNCQDFHSAIGARSDLEANPKTKKNIGIPTTLKWSLESMYNYSKSGFRQPRVLPAAPMIPQGVPKRTKWLPGCQSEGTRPAKG